MLSKWPIRYKLFTGIGLLVVIVATLSWSGFHGVYAYRGLVRSLRDRAVELPLATRLSQHVSDLRVTASDVRGLHDGPAEPSAWDKLVDRFEQQMQEAQQTLEDYREQLERNELSDLQITNGVEERQTLAKIERSVASVEQIEREPQWYTRLADVDNIHSELERLQSLAAELPSYLHQQIHDLAGEVKGQYHTLIALTAITTISAGLMLVLLLRLFYSWVFRPLGVLIQGSRRVAAGDFDHRISLQTDDEMSELAAAMNDMTARFQAIRDDLDRQVQERTKQVVRSEQLASVGFLAAGVAHEINNPLASIALCAESLEGRIEEVLSVAGSGDQPHGVIRNYLRMIQEEAFRCKGITERLLDFSRMGDVTRQNVDLRELVQHVIDMVRHLGRYHDKNIEFIAGEAVVAAVNAQELKQVVLNIITNGLDSLAPGGLLRIEVRKRLAQAEMIFTDNGCGMTPEVLQHLFEPFFTGRRTGIGLGLSITYRIVVDHGGHIDVHSDGPGHGSQFRVSLPLQGKQKEMQHRYQAA